MHAKAGEMRVDASNFRFQCRIKVEEVVSRLALSASKPQVGAKTRRMVYC